MDAYRFRESAREADPAGEREKGKRHGKDTMIETEGTERNLQQFVTAHRCNTGAPPEMIAPPPVPVVCNSERYRRGRNGGKRRIDGKDEIETKKKSRKSIDRAVDVKNTNLSDACLARVDNNVGKSPHIA